MIGIGVTTHNRNSIVSQTLIKIARYTPDAKIVIVDDASDTPLEIVNNIHGFLLYRFEENVGIARAKNKCIELLSDCDHIFLFDDDTYPIVENWYVPYIESKEHHLMYLFKDWSNGNPVGDDEIIYQDNDVVAHSHARGCMLYADRTVIDTVGGMDTRYGKAMNEHLDWSNRIYNAGLTSFRNMDVIGSKNLIYSMDEHQEIASSIKRSDRVAGINKNGELLKESERSTTFSPYGKDVMIACYFANVIDHQRNRQWIPDIREVEKLKRSVESCGIEFVLIHNCFDLPNKVSVSKSPYFERWLKEWQYLRDHKEIRNVFVVDSTDVEMLKNPFLEMKENILYVGDENKTVGDPWMLLNHKERYVNRYIVNNASKKLLNCGVVGGSRQMVMNVCRDIYAYHFKNPQDQVEMGIFNVLMHMKYADKIEYGRHITSEFKKYEQQTNAFFRHK